MTVTGRWYIITSPHGSPYAVYEERESAEDYAANMGDGYGVVDVVPAADLKGAVDTLRELVAAWDATSRELTSATDARWIEAMRVARALVGGQ